MMLPPIRIKHSDRHEAHNGPTGVTITTGTRYFAAVLLQEVYECKRFMAWFWLPPIAFALTAWLTGIIWFVPLVPIWMILVGQDVFPTRRMLENRELMGQAIEIAAISMFYGRIDIEKEYRLQARSLIIANNSYAKKGFWPDIPKIPTSVAYDDENESIDAMVHLLKSVRTEAEKYVKWNMGFLSKYEPLGAHSKGY